MFLIYSFLLSYSAYCYLEEAVSPICNPSNPESFTSVFNRKIQTFTQHKKSKQKLIQDNLNEDLTALDHLDTSVGAIISSMQAGCESFAFPNSQKILVYCNRIVCDPLGEFQSKLWSQCNQACFEGHNETYEAYLNKMPPKKRSVIVPEEGYLTND